MTGVNIVFYFEANVKFILDGWFSKNECATLRAASFSG